MDRYAGHGRNKGDSSERAWNSGGSGFRGRIAPRNFFSLTSHSAMRKASQELQQLIDQLIKQEMK
jgi:hypothetical protein